VQLLTAVLAILVVVAILYEIARRLGVPYPTLLVLGGLGLAFIPGLPRIKLEPDLVLLVFLPPLLLSLLSGTCARTGRLSSACRSAWCCSRWSSSP
jgi:CPA1 family monovalent cation:H+ antiporter